MVLPRLLQLRLAAPALGRARPVRAAARERLAVGELELDQDGEASLGQVAQVHDRTQAAAAAHRNLLAVDLDDGLGHRSVFGDAQADRERAPARAALG